VTVDTTRLTLLSYEDCADRVSSRGWRGVADPVSHATQPMVRLGAIPAHDALSAAYRLRESMVSRDRYRVDVATTGALHPGARSSIPILFWFASHATDALGADHQAFASLLVERRSKARGMHSTPIRPAARTRCPPAAQP
jgi:inosine-uridine nucleoside N-ribohydrolase